MPVGIVVVVVMVVARVVAIVVAVAVVVAMVVTMVAWVGLKSPPNDTTTKTLTTQHSTK